MTDDLTVECPAHLMRLHQDGARVTVAVAGTVLEVTALARRLLVALPESARAELLATVAGAPAAGGAVEVPGTVLEAEVCPELGQLVDLVASIDTRLAAAAAVLLGPGPDAPPAGVALDPIPPGVEVRRSSPLERGEGPCPVPDCTTGGAHSHKPWENLAANGTLDADHTARWPVSTWTEFLRAHGIAQRDAVAHLRGTATAAGEEPPSGLGAVKGRPPFAQVLLDLVADARTAAGQEPF